MKDITPAVRAGHAQRLAIGIRCIIILPRRDRRADYWTSGQQSQQQAQAGGRHCLFSLFERPKKSRFLCKPFPARCMWMARALQKLYLQSSKIVQFIAFSDLYTIWRIALLPSYSASAVQHYGRRDLDAMRRLLRGRRFFRVWFFASALGMGLGSDWAGSAFLSARCTCVRLASAARMLRPHRKSLSFLLRSAQHGSSHPPTIFLAKYASISRSRSAMAS